MCKEKKGLNQFGTFIEYRAKPQRRYYNARCRSCAAKASREWHANPINAEKNFQQARRWREGLKVKVYEHYGDKCRCCGEANYLFLTLDHVNNDGYRERKRPASGESRKRLISTQQYKDIIERGYPDDLQLLCYNCNCGKQRNFGTCPHQKIIEPKYGSRLR